MADKAAPVRLVRINADLADMLAVVTLAGRTTNRDYLDALIRPDVERRFNALPAAVRRLAKARHKTGGAR